MTEPKVTVDANGMVRSKITHSVLCRVEGGTLYLYDKVAKREVAFTPAQLRDLQRTPQEPILDSR